MRLALLILMLLFVLWNRVALSAPPALAGPCSSHVDCKACLSAQQCLFITPIEQPESSFCSSINDPVVSLNRSVRMRSSLEECDDFTPNKQEPPTSAQIWGFGFLSVTLISLTSVLGVSFVPLMSHSFYNNLINCLIGLAVGSLSGSSLFHLIPQAFRLSEVIFYPHHSYLMLSLCIWMGFFLFFLLERVLKVVMRMKELQNKRPQSSLPMDHQICVPQDPSLENEEEQPRIATVAWMVIFGDCVHNFIDGLSIGAAFTESILVGVSVSLAILFEEFPHELGDFAVLLKSGMTICQALTYNFLSACTCYLGLILGILIGQTQSGHQYIFALAGGMFLYISLTDMVPELHKSFDEALTSGRGAAFRVFVLQNVGMLLGIGLIYLLAVYQDQLAHLL